MKEALKSGFFSGCCFGAAWVLIFSPGFIVLCVMGHAHLSAAFAGVVFLVAGIPFGLAMGLFGAYQTRRFLAMDLVPRDEILIHQGGANHFVGLEGVGGWLYLTDRALRFKSHEINIQPHELSILLQEISGALPCRTAGIFPNGLRVDTTDGRSERFVVSGRRRWSGAIVKAKKDTEQTDNHLRMRR
jgi:hypothetical protein